MGERVLQLLGPSTGGIRRHVIALAHGLVARGWEVTVAGPEGVVDGLEWDGPFVVTGTNRAAVLRRLRRLDSDAHLVHAHGLTVGWLASMVSHRPPLVVTVHNAVLDGVSAGGRRARVLHRLERRLPGRVDAVIATSADVAGRLGGGATVIAPVGPLPVPARAATNVRAALGAEPGSPLVVAVGRLHPQKGFDTLIDAATLLRARMPGLRVAIVGEGPDLTRLLARVRDLGLSEVVTLVGPSANAADEIAAADMLVVTSVWESGPLVVAEALELGRPVVSTPVGFVPELITDGVTGRIVPIGDAGVLATTIADVVANPLAAVEQAQVGRQRVHQLLGRDALIDAVVAVYRGVGVR